jgi:Holliday junction resolvase
MCIGSKRLYSGPKRRDANQRKIVQVLRKLGASVVITADVGRGFPDLVVGYGGVTYLVEVKNRSTLRRSQRAFREQWRGGEIVLLRSPEEAVQWLARLRDAQQASKAPDSGAPGT